MKKLQLGKRKIILSLAVMASILTVGIVGSMAILSSQAGTVDNNFTIGNIETEIVENVNTTGTKDVKIANTGKNDCLVRAKVTVSPSDVATIDGWNTGTTAGTWTTADEDGYYYFNGVVPATAAAESADQQTYYSTNSLFTGYKIAGIDDWNNIPSGFVMPEFTITVSQEAIQATVTSTDGEVISAYDEDGKYNAEQAARIWAIYDGN